MKIALLGATGVVGGAMLEQLQLRGFSDDTLIPAASSRSVGKTIVFAGRTLVIVSPEQVLQAKPDVALFAAGGDFSREWTPRFAEAGIRVVDNSSAWRLDPSVPLLIPEVNPHHLRPEHRIIANPNCSTIQLLMAIAPIHREYGIKRLHISTYQSVSGSGHKGIVQLERERMGEYPVGSPAYQHPIDLNCIPQCDDFLPNGYTKEEMKLVDETRKMLDAPAMRISATAVRVPVWGGHSEAVSLECEKPVTPQEVRELLSSQPGLVVQDDPQRALYPMPRNAQGHDEVYVGRIREDIACPNYGINMWVVADNIRKGAATNAVQIVQLLLGREWA